MCLLLCSVNFPSNSHLQKIPGLKKRELKGFIVQKSFHYHIPYPEADTISHDEDMLSWKQKKRKRKLDIYSNT